MVALRVSQRQSWWPPASFEASPNLEGRPDWASADMVGPAGAQTLTSATRGGRLVAHRQPGGTPPSTAPTEPPHLAHVRALFAPPRRGRGRRLGIWGGSTSRGAGGAGSRAHHQAGVELRLRWRVLRVLQRHMGQDFFNGGGDSIRRLAIPRRGSKVGPRCVPGPRPSLGPNTDARAEWCSVDGPTGPSGEERGADRRA